jgi:tetratricopeptide (TPR) repeat protein
MRVAEMVRAGVRRVVAIVDGVMASARAMAPARGRWWARSGRAAAGIVVIPLLALLAACDQPESNLAQGDRLWADSSYDKALAEYRLALLQSARDDATYLRVAHAYARTGRLDQAAEIYDVLLARSPDYANQAVFDYLTVARRALARGDRHGVARGAELALALQPALPLGELAPVLARYYSDTGDPERALRFYQRSLTTAPRDSIPGVLFQLGSIHAGRGNCRDALGYFSAARERARTRARADEAKWRLGNCAFELAREARQGGQVLEALTYLDTMLALQVPANLMDQAWFEHGEVLFTLGRFDQALESYRQVLELNRSRGGLLVDRARQRIDQIRFGT